MAKHLNNYVADTGLSFVLTMLGRLIESKHAAPMAEWEPPTEYSDVWAGNADTDKYWSK